MGFVYMNDNSLIAEKFTNYCIEYGFNSHNCERLTTDKVYGMLYDCWIDRIKEKEYTYDTYLFEQDAGRILEEKAEQVAKLIWHPSGYKAFKVHHPERTINAPFYSDRIVEQWLTERYIIPFWQDKLIPNNFACQKDKGQHKAVEQVKRAMMDAYSKYGMDFWFFQGDMQGYYDNISQARVKEINKGMDPYGHFLLCNIIDSWEELDCYAKQNNPDGKFGFPKGTLPSQWVGITVLNELDHILSAYERCLDFVRYMDDFIGFYPAKRDCIENKATVENYLQDKELGIRLHSKKTAYAPINRGFNFCGWHFRLREDGSVEMKVRQDRKKLKKKEFAAKQRAYAAGKISGNEVSNSMQSTFAHYKHGDTKNLRKYMSNRYRFQRTVD